VTIITLAAAATLGLLPAAAQILYGSLVGNITDAYGAVVPNAAVTATDQGTGNEGYNHVSAYQFIDLQPGHLPKKVSLSGFKTLERRDVRVTGNHFSRADLLLRSEALNNRSTSWVRHRGCRPSEPKRAQWYRSAF
jgi:hypothetical protein